jgi:hypothetical protein
MRNERIGKWKMLRDVLIDRVVKSGHGVKRFGKQLFIIPVGNGLTV